MWWEAVGVLSLYGFTQEIRLKNNKIFFNFLLKALRYHDVLNDVHKKTLLDVRRFSNIKWSSKKNPTAVSKLGVVICENFGMAYVIWRRCDFVTAPGATSITIGIAPFRTIAWDVI